MMEQTWAILVDGYRELNSKKLFWISLAISALCVLVFLVIGINERGVTFLTFTVANPVFNTNFLTPATYYKWVFITFGVKLWLAWIATILALISTAPIFPDFLAGGAVEMVVSKPIGRVRLFLTKYVTALLFVAVQITVFTGLCLIMLGIRGGAWDFRILWAIPIVLAFYSFLYCICALMGVLTRSTIASLLLTVLIWFLLFLLSMGDVVTLTGREYYTGQVAALEKRVPRMEKAAQAEADRRSEEKAARDEQREPVSPPPVREHTDEELFSANVFLEAKRRELDEARKDLSTLEFWNGLLLKVKAPLPKTTETINLLERTVMTEQEMRRFSTEQIERNSTQERARRKERDKSITADDEVVTRTDTAAAAESAFKGRSLWWVLGTSFAFEAAVLGFASWRFARRDF